MVGREGVYRQCGCDDRIDCIATSLKNPLADLRSSQLLAGDCPGWHLKSRSLFAPRRPACLYDVMSMFDGTKVCLQDERDSVPGDCRLHFPFFPESQDILQKSMARIRASALSCRSALDPFIAWNHGVPATMTCQQRMYGGLASNMHYPIMCRRIPSSSSHRVPKVIDDQRAVDRHEGKGTAVMHENVKVRERSSSDSKEPCMLCLCYCPSTGWLFTSLLLVRSSTLKSASYPARMPLIRPHRNVALTRLSQRREPWNPLVWQSEAMSPV